MDIHFDDEEHLLVAYVSDVLSSVIDELSSMKKKLSPEDTDNIDNPLPKRVCFRSPLVSIRELSIDEEDSFGPFDDTLPFEDNSSESPFGVNDQIVPTTDTQIMTTSQHPTLNDDNTIENTNWWRHKRKCVESYHDFVHEFRRQKSQRLSDNEELAWCSLDDIDDTDICCEKEDFAMIQSTPNDEVDVDSSQIDEDFDMQSDSVNFVSYHVLSYALRKYERILLNAQPGFQKHDKLTTVNGKSGLLKQGPEIKKLKLWTSSDSPGLLHEQMEICDRCFRDQSPTARRNQHVESSRSLMDNEGQKAHETVSEKTRWLTYKRLSPEKKRTFTNEFSLEELRSFLIPECGDDDVVSQYEILSPKNVQASCENVVRVCLTASTEHLNYSPVKNFPKLIAPIGNKIEIDEDNLVFAGDQEFLSPLKSTSNECREVRHYGRPLKRKSAVDDMISELMASQAARPKWISGDLKPIPPKRPIPNLRSTIFANCVNPMEDLSIVPDIDNLPELDCDYEFSSTKGEERKKSLGEERNCYSWKNSSHRSEFDCYNRSLESSEDKITPPKLRLGLSKKVKVKKCLHPYHHNTSE